MKRSHGIFVVALVLLTAVGTTYAGNQQALPNTGRLTIQGRVMDLAGNPLSEARVQVYLNGRHFQPTAGMHSRTGAHEENTSGDQGLFEIKLNAPLTELERGQWAVKVIRSNFRPSRIVPLGDLQSGGIDRRGARLFSTSTEVTLERHKSPAFWLALAILVGTYVLISLEIVHRTLAALLGAALILTISHTIGHYDDSYRILTYEQALRVVDWNVIFLLLGMMIIVGVLKESGVFQWLAYKSFQLARGKVVLLTAVLCVVTAVLSAFLDNVTTMLLLTPVTMEIAIVLGLNPFSLLLPEIMASNFGGTATLIGDPPNIMIGSAAGLTFNHFVLNLTPVVIVVMAIQLLYTRWYYGKEYAGANVEDVEETISFLKQKYRITGPRVLAIGGSVLLGVIVLFVLHGYFHMEVSVAALLGGALIIALTRTDIVHILEREIEWPSLVFFIMLFIIVGAANETGILQLIADWIMRVSEGNLVLALLIILWVTGIVSAIVDNIPFTATMLPIVAFLTRTLPGAESGVLWWALALGACFGGNGTIIGASANVVTTGIAERAGYVVSFYEFLKHGAPITIISLIISSIYLLLFY